MDQEREERAREQAEQERKEQEEIERIRREELEKKDEIVRMKIELANQVPDEPEPNVEDVVRVVIKLPGGQRLDRRSVQLLDGSEVMGRYFQVPSLSLTEAHLLLRILSPRQVRFSQFHPHPSFRVSVLTSLIS